MELSKRIQTYQQILDQYEPHGRAVRRCVTLAGDNLQDRELLYLHVFAPVLTEYIEWVLAEAAAAGKKRLYFLARDGYHMYFLARQLCASRGIQIECRYLRVSRFSIRQAEYHLQGEDCLGHICTGGIDVTFDKIMQRAGLSDDEADEIASLTGYTARRKQVLHQRQIAALKKELHAVPVFFEYVGAHSAEAYPSAAGYLRQEGLLEPVPYALVDSGWIGTLQQSIERLIRYASGDAERRIDGYYFGLYELPTDALRDRYRAFYFGPMDHIRRKVRFSNCLFEAVFSAPDGMTLGYRTQSGEYLAIESSHENPNGGTILRDSVLMHMYADAYLEETAGADQKNPSGQRKNSHGQMTERLLSILMGKPALAEVLGFGDLMFCDDVLELQMQKVAAELSEQEIRRQRFLHKALIVSGLRSGEVIHESAWIEGSIVRNGTHIASNLRHAALYKYFVYLRKARKQHD